MKKLLLVSIIIFISFANFVSAQKTNLYNELTSVMVSSKPVGMAEYQKMQIPWYEINMGGFGYIAEKKEFQGQFKFYDFTVSKRKVIITWMGVGSKITRSEKNKIEKELIKAVKMYQK